MDTSQLMERFEGTAINRDELSNYQRWALDYFHQEQYVVNPALNTTMQLDMTTAANKFHQGKKVGSLTAYLTWCLLQALNHHREFNFRQLGGQWYIFKNLPLFFPVAIPGRERFAEVFLENVRGKSWPEFAQSYGEQVALLQSATAVYHPLESELWSIADFIGNLPYLRFTALSLPQPRMMNGRAVFYFGRRYESHAKTFVPLSITFDHANTDPLVLNQLMETYMEYLCGDACLMA